MNYLEVFQNYTEAKCDLEDKILKLGNLDDWDDIGWDDYDSSLEIYGVANTWRPPVELLNHIFESGFFKLYVNHLNGWETHYSQNNREGWRVKYGNKHNDGNWIYLVDKVPESWNTFTKNCVIVSEEDSNKD